MGIDESLAREIVRRVISVCQPDKIIVFGSAAAGTMTEDSDIDLLIVDPDPRDQRQTYLRIRNALRGMGHPFDIVFIGTQWFEQSKNVIGGIANPAERHGKVIYEAA
jgi:predicted nucleotidyltransferase